MEVGWMNWAELRNVVTCYGYTREAELVIYTQEHISTNTLVSIPSPRVTPMCKPCAFHFDVHSLTGDSSGSPPAVAPPPPSPAAHTPVMVCNSRQNGHCDYDAGYCLYARSSV